VPLTPFERMPGDARLWVFAASQTLNKDQGSRLLAATDAFLAGWSAHRVPLSTARELRYDQFLFVAADEAAAGASGCSIDALVRFMRDVEGQIGARLTDNGLVWFRDPAGNVLCVSRAEFQDLADRGAARADTIVFDNTVQTVGALRGGQWELPAKLSWHGRAFLPRSAHAE
jgi:hypothetical protein